MNLLLLIAEILLVGAFTLFIWTFFRHLFFVNIGEGEFGIKRNIYWGPNRSQTNVLAKDNEIGYLPKIYTTGNRLFMPILQSMEVYPYTTVPVGQLAYIFAQIGQINPNNENESIPLAEYKDGFGNYQDVETFISLGGMQGLQKHLLEQGSYPIHPVAFLVFMVDKEVIGKPIKGSDYAKGGMSQDLLGFHRDMFNSVLPFQPIEYAGFSALCLGQYEITFDLVIRAEYIDRNMILEFAKNTGKEPLFNILKQRIKAAILPILMTKASNEWQAKINDLHDLIFEKISPILETSHLKIKKEDIIISNPRLDPKLEDQLKIATLNRVSAETKVTEIPVQEAQGQVNRATSKAESMAMLGPKEVEVEAALLNQKMVKIDQENFIGWANSLGMETAMMKFALELSSKSDSKLKQLYPFALSLQPILQSLISKIPSKAKLSPENVQQLLQEAEKAVDSLPPEHKEKAGALVQFIKALPK